MYAPKAVRRFWLAGRISVDVAIANLVRMKMPPDAARTYLLTGK